MAQVNFISATKLVELLIEANRFGQMNVRVLTTNQLALGIDPLHPKVLAHHRKVLRGDQGQHDRMSVAEGDASRGPKGV